MKTTAIGKEAEAAVAHHLKNQGYEIVTRNWRTRTCEIDIVAMKNKIVFFVEVKYRRQHEQGDGFEYITKTKLKQMKFAARQWNAENDWSGDYRLVAVSLDGLSFNNIDLIEI